MILLYSVSYKSPAKSIFGGGFSFTCPTKTELLVVQPAANYSAQRDHFISL